jgi:hypothetical protein
VTTPSPRRGLRRPGRTPGTVNLGVALAVLGVLLPLLLNAATSAPPAAAEFSPNAQQVIKKAPDGQAAEVNGTGDGQGSDGGEGGSPPPPPTPPPPTAMPTPKEELPENLLKRCVGPPPLRQIEDPQSPPCIAYWAGDNGGATAKGVTKDAIYIAVPTPESSETQYTALANFFNKRFQLYGRKIVLQFCGNGQGARDEAGQVADAAEAAAGCGNGIQPFASTFYRQNNGAYYMPAMGCRHKTIVVGSYSLYDKKFLERCAPYLYQYPMEADEEFANVGEWICNRLAGRTARYADGNDGSTPAQPIASQQRKFGIMLAPFTATDPVARPEALDPIRKRLQACGAEVPMDRVIINPVTALFDPSSAQNAVLQMRSAGVTSIVCMCNFFSFGSLQRAAAASSFQPEWVTSTFGLNDVNSSFILGAGPASQMQNTFGITFHPRIVKPLINPYNVAVQEGDPSVTPDTATTGEAKLEVYRALLLIASGIQMAGPNLTVQSFRDGLRRTAFPNPFHRTMAGAVDVRPNGYSLTADAAEWYFDTQAVGPFADSAAKPGTVCYLDGGKRRTLGAWPKGEAPFFTGRCDSGA